MNAQTRVPDDGTSPIWYNNGNVGIGTNAPLDRLNVNGNLFFYNTGADGTPNTIIGTIGARVRSYGNTTGASFANIKILTDATTWTRGVLTFSTNSFDGTDGNYPPVERMRITSDGKIGIGTTLPYQQLSITGGIGFANYNSLDKKLYSPADGTLEWFTHDWAGEHGFAVSHQGERRVYLNTNGNSYFIGGNVGIGTTTPGVKLDVNGTIHAREVKVDLNFPADYVFKPDYKLMSLKEVEQFIKTNSHLPEIPSAIEIKENGLNMGDMQNKLLQKIEEMTLYMIEQNKINEQQSNTIEELKQLVKSQSEKIEKLESTLK
jgi:hypothetical protein